ncbi:protease HtpX [Neptunomonas sp.]|uniref:protease HtpX n=1 Tax=Neptunomonas sp. TaxID=1971898 RepID=UPI0025FD50FD|nr:protease HtpX [Neptunomonas sp.]
MRIILFLLTNLAVILIASVTLSLLGVEHYLSGTGLNLTSLLIFCAVFGFVGSFFSLFISKWMAKRSTGTQIIEQPRTQEEKWLVDTVAELAKKADIGMPEVGIFHSDQANAFATGWNKNKALVAVSTGLLQRFRPEEARAVMAHEIGHVANGDMVTLTLIQGVVNTFVMFFARIVGYVVDSMLRKGSNSGRVGFGFYIATFVAEIIFGIAASIIVAWFSRRREFKADEAGAQFGSTAGMIGALQRLKAESGMADQLPSQMTAFGISSHTKMGFMALMSSHPPLDDRIAALQNRH